MIISEHSNNDQNLLEKIVNILFALFLIVGIVFFLFVLYGGNIEFVEYELLPFVIVSTSVVVGSFFIIRTYIKSEISIKEIDMSKYFSDFIQKISDKQDAKFDKQDAKFDRQYKLIDEKFANLEQKLANQTAEIKQLLEKNRN